MEGDRATILVVDDDPRNRSLLRASLEVEHDIVEAEDGPSALQVLALHAVDVVLLDVMMPGISGIDVCRTIKQRYAGEMLPVLLLTALNEQDDRNAGLAAGADDFITKPFDRRELKLRIASFLRQRRQDQLIRRQLQALRDLDALKDDLVSLLVHDLRNPLTAMSSLLTVMREDARDRQLVSDIDLVVGAANKLNETLEDLLRVRQLEEGRLLLHRADVSMLGVVTDAVRTVGSAGRERRVDVAVECRHDATISVDAKLLRRALENILTNAIKYAPIGSHVEVTVEESDGELRVEIADRGPGIPVPQRGMLFEKFGRLEPRNSDRDGFGLGLYLVKLVAGAHQGRVAVRDRTGGGTVFALSLPQRRS